MKIKTLTCHNVYNYGAVLQEYALISYLKALGHEVEAINYQPAYLRSNFGFFIIENPKYDKTFIRWIYRALKFPIRMLLKGKQHEFNLFTQKFIPQTEVVYASNQDLIDFTPDADVFIVGSDQIWNPLVENGHDPAFYLDFVKADARKVAYAASFATGHLPDNHLEHITPWLNQLDAISVRESSAVSLLEEAKLKTEVQLVLDPVFLLDKQHWGSLQAPYQHPKPFILVYDFENDVNIKEQAKYYAELYDWDIIALNQKIDYADVNFFHKGPLHFLALMQSASMVLTNSFHGLVFALVFHKPFLIFNRQANINARMNDLLLSLNIADQALYTQRTEHLPTFDYTAIDRLLSKWINTSKQFILNHLIERPKTLKTSLLFSIESLALGGAEKSLTVLLQNLNVNLFQVHLLLFSKQGLFIPQIPEQVKVYYHPSVRLILRDRIMFKLSKMTNIERFHAAQWFWSLFGASYYKFPKQVDVAVSYSQGFVTYYGANNISATKKLAWVNTDYFKAGYHAHIDWPYYQSYDAIIAVSESAKKSFESCFGPPNRLNKTVQVIEDILDVDYIRHRAKDPIAFKFNDNAFKLTTVCRLSKEKGLDMALQACFNLKQSGYKIQWLVIGDGPYRSELQNLIVQKDLINEFLLLGAMPNPYPYVKQADVYIQPSYFEGFGIAMHEAAALSKAIIATNFPTAYNLIRHNENGLISKMDAKALYNAIIDLILQPDKIKQFEGAQSTYCSNKLQTLAQLESMFNDPSTI